MMARRLGTGSLVALAASLLVGCVDHPEAPTLPPDGSPKLPTAANSPQSPSTTPSKKDPIETPAPVKPTLEVLTEVVYVLMKNDEGEWMCTGTLVAKDVVITAGHCLEEGRFRDYEIVAPLAPGKPRVKASSPTPLSNDFNDAAQPDFGFLHLDTPIDLPQYAELTDISQRVGNGEKLTATTVVRSEEALEAPFKAVDGLALKSMTSEGYEHGFGVPLFSHGGDSGAGVFLVENGRPTHKLVGVCRQPDPDTNTDELTRVDPDILGWFKDNAGK